MKNMWEGLWQKPKPIGLGSTQPPIFGDMEGEDTSSGGGGSDPYAGMWGGWNDTSLFGTNDPGGWGGAVTPPLASSSPWGSGTYSNPANELSGGGPGGYTPVTNPTTQTFGSNDQYGLGLTNVVPRKNVAKEAVRGALSTTLPIPGVDKDQPGWQRGLNFGTSFIPGVGWVGKAGIGAFAGGVGALLQNRKAGEWERTLGGGGQTGPGSPEQSALDTAFAQGPGFSSGWTPPEASSVTTSSAGGGGLPPETSGTGSGQTPSTGNPPYAGPNNSGINAATNWAEEMIRQAYLKYLGREPSASELRTNLQGGVTANDPRMQAIITHIQNSPEAYQYYIWSQQNPPASSTTTTTPDTSQWNTGGFPAPKTTATSPKGVLPGWDPGKWADPKHQTPKYVVGRILSQYGTDDAGFAQAIAEIQKAYPGTTTNGKDTITIPGVGTIDIRTGSASGGTGYAWQPLTNPDGSPLADSTASSGSSGGGHDPEDLAWAYGGAVDTTRTLIQKLMQQLALGGALR